MKKISLLASTFVLASAIAQGANFRFLAWDEEVAARKLAVSEEKGIQPIKGLHPLSRSSEISVTLGEKGLVVVATDKTTADGKQAELRVERAASLKNGLVLLLPDNNAPTGLRAVAFEDSRDAFPWGTIRFLNATGKPMGLIMGRTRKLLPAKWDPVDIKPEGATSNSFALYTQDDPKTPTYSASWTQDPEQRRLAILTTSTDARLGSIAVKVVPEHRLETVVQPEENER